MSLVFKIITAAHAKGTHHKLALDALTHLQGDQQAKWRKLFLKHVERYLEGSKAPDKVFKDFKNHVYHVRDNGWGGAPAKAREWYDKTVSALKAEDWDEAAYAAGVLSHYYTDPIQPFHTAQSEAESAIHRAAEWSISKSYDDLRKRGENKRATLTVEQASGPDYIEEMVRNGAQYSNRYYESIIAHYNFDRGVVNPPEGFNEQGNEILSELIAYATLGFSQILDKAIQEAAVAAPDVSISAKSIITTLKIPIRWVTSKIEDRAERKLVEAMYDEWQETGAVEKTLPEDDRTIRDLHAKEVLRKPVTQQEPGEAAMLQAQEALTEATKTLKDVVADRIAAEFYLDVNDDVERAPSIGPKTAERLEIAGVFTVSDLLSADPEQVAWKAGIGYITAEAVIDWQDQAGLVCSIPRLRGWQAILLVGLGQRDVSQLIKSDPYTLLTAVTAYMATPEGERDVRTDIEPDLDMVRDWIDRAILVAPQKAA